MAATVATYVPDSRVTCAMTETGVMTRGTSTVTSTLLVVCVEVCVVLLIQMILIFRKLRHGFFDIACRIA
jgi:hypothetical protein